MMNIEQITARLAKLPDQALQQYAAMHKNDPYIIALAVSESNRRKQMRQAAQGAQGEMEQPTVVDQGIAEMAPAPVAPQQMMPEDTGIAQLPVGEMDFAGGGIVAFADGGDVERYQSNGLVQPPASGGTEFAIPGMVQPSRSFMPQAGAPEQEPFLRRMFRDAELQAARRRAAEAQARIDRGLNYESDREAVLMLQSLERQAAAPNPATSVGVQGAAAENLSGMDRRMMANPQTFAASAPGAAVAAGPGAGGPGAGGPGAGGPGAGGPGAGGPGAGGPGTTPARAAAPGMDIPAMISRELSAAEQKENPFAAAVMQLGQDRVSAKEEEVKGLEAIQKQFADIYKGRKERLDTREGELGKMKDQYTGLALLQAGATMMSTTGGIGKALGKGVQVGSEQYAAGLGKLQAAKDKIVEARDRLEEIEAQRNELSARELNKARNEVKQTGISAREDLIKSNMQMYGVNRETAMKLVEMQVRVGTTQMEVAGRMEAARIAASAPGSQERLFAALGGGDVAKGLKAYSEAMGPEAKGQAAVLQKFATVEGQTALRMMEASSDPQQKALASSIRAALLSQMATDRPTGPPRD
jgi:hypothetical protein